MVKFDAVYWQILDDVLQFYYLDDCDYQVKVGSRHKHFRIAVIDLDGLMTGNSRPISAGRDWPLYGDE
jgi:hypothetical protein